MRVLNTLRACSKYVVTRASYYNPISKHKKLLNEINDEKDRAVMSLHMAEKHADEFREHGKTGFLSNFIVNSILGTDTKQLRTEIKEAEPHLNETELAVKVEAQRKRGNLFNRFNLLLNYSQAIPLFLSAWNQGGPAEGIFTGLSAILTPTIIQQLDKKVLGGKIKNEDLRNGIDLATNLFGFQIVQWIMDNTLGSVARTIDFKLNPQKALEQQTYLQTPNGINGLTTAQMGGAGV